MQVAGSVGEADEATVVGMLAGASRLTSLRVSPATPLLRCPSALAALCRTSGLQHLELRHHQMSPAADFPDSDAAAAFTTAVRRLTRITALDLRHCGIDERFLDAGFDRALSELSQLHSIALSDNLLRGAVPPLAAAALELPHIQEVDVSNNGYPVLLGPEGSWGDSEGPSEGSASGSIGEMQALLQVAAARGVCLKHGDDLERAVSCQSSQGDGSAARFRV